MESREMGSRIALWKNGGYGSAIDLFLTSIHTQAHCLMRRHKHKIRTVRKWNEFIGMK